MRIGLLGAGDMGSVHAGTLASLPDVEIAWITGRTRSRAEALAARIGTRAYTDPWAILDDDSVDAVDITYPSALHREWVVAALERGKHVLCETPLALTLSDADAMVDAAREHGKILMPAQVQRFGVETAFIHDEVVSGKLGRPIAAHAASRSPFYGAGEKRPIDLYGGPMLDLLIHPIDTVIWLLGMPVSVSGTGQIGPSGTIDQAFVALECDNASGMAEISAMMPESFTITLRVLCEGGALEAYVRLGKTEEFGLVRYPAKGEPEELSPEGGDPYMRECAYFVDCMRGQADPFLVSPEGERDAIRVALTAQEAIEQGRSIAL